MQPQLNDDLKFIRSMVERTQPRIYAAAPILITWGLVSLIGFPATGWMAANRMYGQIDALWMVLVVLIGAPASAHFGYRAQKRCEHGCVIPAVSALRRQREWKTAHAGA